MASRGSPPVRRRAVVGRRAVGGAVVAAVVATGCDGSPATPVTPGSRGAPTPTNGSSTGPLPPAQADAEADLRLLRRAVELTGALGGLVRAVGERHGSLRPRLSGLAGVHEAHAAVLAEAHDSPSSQPGRKPTVPAAPAAALTVVRTREGAAQRELVDLSVRARSGPFARLLASMAAGIAARLAVLADAPASPAAGLAAASGGRAGAGRGPT